MDKIGKGPWTMKCPVCDVEMVSEEVEIPGPNVVIDYCPDCRGIWLDEGELNKLLHSKAPERVIKGSPGIKRWGKEVCPRCKGAMQIKFVHDIEVDECTECSGIWLDRGELKRLKDSDLDKMGERRIKHMLKSLRDDIKGKL
jgi:hypothetical protein